jgi:endonuclease G, mitochondrial
MQISDQKISIFTGPLFRADDTMYSGILQIPSEIWKIIVLKKGDNRLYATGFLLTQKNLTRDQGFAYGSYRIYQIPLE